MTRFIATKHFTENTSIEVCYNTKSISISFTAWQYSTRSSWGHKIRMSVHFKDSVNYQYTEKKIIYYNRTWESYRFQSIIHTALHSLIKDYKKAKKYCDVLDKYLRKEGL